MGGPLVSIIVPVYNVEEYVEICLESIRTQTYQNIEVIIVNDGSPDNSGTTCKKFIDNYQDNRFKLFSKSNGGLSDARNYGIRHTSAESEFVIFVDSDDELTPDAVESLISNADHSKLVIGKLYRCQKSNRKNISGPINNTDLSDIWNNQHFLRSLKVGIVNSCCGNCYSLKCIRENSLEFKKELPEDTQFNLQYLSIINEVILLERPIYYYYIWQNSMSTVPHEIIFKNYMKLQAQLYDIISEEYHKYVDEFVYPHYRRNMMNYISIGDYSLSKRYLKERLIRNAFSAYHPVSTGDFITHIFLRLGFFRLLRKL